MRFLWFMLFSVFSSSGVASINPSATEITLDGGGKKSVKIRVANSATEQAYAKIENVVKVTNPGRKDKLEVPVNNIDNPELMITPKLMVIPPNGEVDVIIADLVQDRHHEDAYYFTITPVEPGVENGIKLSINYKVLVRALPKEIHSKLLTSVSSTYVDLINQGNVRYSLKNMRLCEHEEINCREAYPGGNIRIYPGNTLKILKKNSEVLYFTEDFPKYKKHVVQ